MALYYDGTLTPVVDYPARAFTTNEAPDHLMPLSKSEDIVNAPKGKEIALFLDYDGTMIPMVDYPSFTTNEMRLSERVLARMRSYKAPDRLMTLSKSEDVVNAPKGKKIALFLDYDGTLSPVVDEPSFMTNETRKAVRELARDFPMIVMGRNCSYKARSFKEINSESCSEGQKLASPGVDVGGRFHNEILVNASPAIGSGHGGGSSGDGGSCEFHTIRIEEGEGDRESASIQQYSLTSSNNASVASHQSNDQQQPPSSPPSGIQIGDGTSLEEPKFNISGLAKIFMVVTTADCGTIVTTRLSARNSLSEIDRILLASAMICSAAGFLLCFGGYILDNSGRAKLAALLLTGIGAVAAICGFILMMSSLF